MEFVLDRLHIIAFFQRAHVMHFMRLSFFMALGPTLGHLDWFAKLGSMHDSMVPDLVANPGFVRASPAGRHFGGIGEGQRDTPVS